jgi:class 3 adenylate cyclase/tetratricopeptide (TPR) repeat protein
MECPHCGWSNPQQARYCANCGTALAQGAPVTGQESLNAAQEAVRRLRRYLPAVVAEGVLHDQERLRGERREVAVLFADAVNFTRLSASLDAEATFQLINDLLGRLVACVHRYDGLVDKFTGDGLMAVFGAPVAHENDPELAVRAALDMQQAAAEFAPIAQARLGAPLQIRIGIHSGPAIAGILGTAEQVAYTVIGETVNVAARLEARAEPGHILVSERIYQQTQPVFHFQALEPMQLKGLDQLLSVYEPLGTRAAPLPTRGVAGVRAVFLGRDHELNQLCTLTTTLSKTQQGRLVVIQGEAGMGKSRLINECLARLATDRPLVWQGRGLPYAQGIGYGVFRSLMQDALRSSDQESAWDNEVSLSLRPFLYQLLGLPLEPAEQDVLRYLEPERIKELTTLAFREWVLGQARRRPLLFILDDFHWADDLSRDLLSSIITLIHVAPILLIVLTRPQPELPPDQQLTAIDPTALMLELTPLSREQSRALLEHLVALEQLPESLIETILTRAEGNPFYLEEFVRMLIEKEALRPGATRWEVAPDVALQELEIPTSLQGLIMARVDRLPENLQQILRQAAIIGMQFSARLLEEMAHRLRGSANVLPALQRLMELGLLVERPEAGEQVYAFRHIVAQETIYNGLLRSQRPTLHRTVAEAIETLAASDLNSQAEVLAFHYDRAYLREKALFYSLLAGERARRRFDNRAAIEHYSRAIQLSQHISGHDSERWQAVIGLGEVEQHIGQYEESIACFRAALDDSRQASAEVRAQAMLRLGQVWDKRGNVEEAETWLRQGISEAYRATPPVPHLQAQIYSELGWLSLRRGNLPEAQQWLEKGLALVTDTTHYDVLSSILNRLGAIHYNRGAWQQAMECVERSLALREQLGDIVGLARSYNNLGILKKNSGDWIGALESYEKSLQFMERIGDIEGIAIACTNIGSVYVESGKWQQAEDKLLRSFTIAQQIAHPFELAQAHMNLGRLYLLQERWNECADHLNAAIPLYQEAGARANASLIDAYNLAGILNLEQGQKDAAQQWAWRSFELLRQSTGAETGDSAEWGRYEQLMGRLSQAAGDLETARYHFNLSLSIFKQGGPEIEYARTLYWSAILSLAQEQPERARGELLTARQIFQRFGAMADLRRAEQGLANLTA